MNTMAQASFAKKRNNPRFAFLANAEVTLRDGTSVLAQASQLSSRGCYIETLEPIPVAAEFRLRLSDGTSSCKLPGKVIYINSGGASGILGIGVAFGEMTVDQHAAIDRWLRKLAKKRMGVAIDQWLRDLAKRGIGVGHKT